MSCPLGVEQLMSCDELTIKTKMKWCSSGYSVKAPHLGKILTVYGNTNFKVKDLNDTTIAKFQISQKWFQTDTMTVRSYNGPPVLVKLRGNFKHSICLYEYENGRDGHEEPVLKLKAAHVLGSKLNILAKDHIIGSVKQSWGDYIVTFPRDLDVRYKLGLLAACVYERHLSQRQTSSS